jgi:hypothetical protein
MLLLLLPKLVAQVEIQNTLLALLLSEKTTDSLMLHHLLLLKLLEQHTILCFYMGEWDLEKLI